MRFTKMQGVGNDFVLVDRARLPAGADLPRLAVQACARGFGVGADGLLVAERTAHADAGFSMRMFNPDGSEDMCGNGLRCVGLWAHREGWVAGPRFSVATKDGLRRVELLDIGDAQGLLRVDMGVPRFLPAEIPFCGSSRQAADDGRIINYPLVISDDKYLITCVNTGSTHTVIFDYAPPEEETFQTISPLIENHPLFPERTSVLWATPRDAKTIDIRIWERGAGETLGCGTGACAVGVAARLRGLVGPKPVDVISKGGTLRIAWQGAGHDVLMTGPAQAVFEGDMAVDAAT